MKYDVIIIGSGPAGLTAAIYATRANLKVLIIESEVYGGKLSRIHRIDNYPGNPEISGMVLSENMLIQVKKLNVDIISDTIISINNHALTGKNDVYEAKAIIVCSGAKEKAIDVENAKDFIGKGISYCATCDGFFYRNKQVIVVGSSNSALEEAEYLSSLASKVTIISKRNDYLADSSLIEKIENNPKIVSLFNSSIKSLIIEDNKITGVNTESGISIPCSGIFPYVGTSPNTDFLDASLLDDKGYLLVDESMASKCDYIFGAGDCINSKLKQIVTACSNGAIAATSAISYLKHS